MSNVLLIGQISYKYNKRNKDGTFPEVWSCLVTCPITLSSKTIHFFSTIHRYYIYELKCLRCADLVCCYIIHRLIL